jgi:predicted ATP-grasp superfamily ATP-dependent carboligase
MDLVRPLGLAGIKCAVAVPPGAASRYSRFTVQALDWAHPWESPSELVQALVRFGKVQSDRPVLFFQSDGDLLLVSRNRELLQKFFRFSIADQELVEDLVDKERFQALAERLQLPVPPAQRLHSTPDLPKLTLRFPIIVKPLTRRPELWKIVAKSGKALRIDTAQEFRSKWPELNASGVEMLAQELIPGGECRIESYHVYVDDDGRILGEFTGRKLRTYPREYGDSTALETTDAADVATLGRDLIQRLHLRGVAKFDFKRAPDGHLYLLEVNPRFNLWHHLGALSGVNLPAMVHHDLLGQPKPEMRSAIAGLRWCRAWQDVLAARQSQVKTISWLRWASSCEAKRLLALDDPMPLVGGAFWRLKDFIKKVLGNLKLGSPSAHGSTAEPGAPTFANSPPVGRG